MVGSRSSCEGVPMPKDAAFRPLAQGPTGNADDGLGFQTGSPSAFFTQAGSPADLRAPLRGSALACKLPYCERLLSILSLNTRLDDSGAVPGLL